LAALKGAPGNDGHTPQITASKNNGVTTISVDGTAVATINDGQDGTDGQDGSVLNQIQSNWEETDTSSAAYIQNKPTIPTVPTLATVATSGNYNDLTNTPDLTNYITKNS
jgi:hypothetical protein